MSRNRTSKRSDFNHNDIPTKANRILNLILLGMVIIIIRIWHLAVIQYDQKLEEAQKPQKKIIIEPATRATIRDRFNLPLAINKIQYQATILYSQLKDIPTSVWEKDASGKKIKKAKRKEYTRQLAELLATELNLDAGRIEDLIYAKASYYSQVPFVIKDELSEKEYYRLKILEKDWPGIYVRKLPKRYYPRERLGADIIGYMGAINKQEYEAILQEMKGLEQFIQANEEGQELVSNIEEVAQARKRLKDLEEKAYTIHDYIGKTGIEGIYEKQLRGFYGKKIFQSDSKGNFLRELPGSRPALSGKRILLTISAELQEYAEQLLAQNEALRIVRMSRLGAIKNTILAIKHPWIKGGSIVVMDPQTAEILTLASHPRFDPNDFIASGNPDINREKRNRINRWFENDVYIANLWNQQQPLERERYSSGSQQFYDEECWISWLTYLNFILPADSDLKKSMNQISTLEQAWAIQCDVDRLLALCDNKNLYQVFNVLYNEEPHVVYKEKEMGDKRNIEAAIQKNKDAIKKIKKNLNRYLETTPQNYDKVLLVDICRLALDHDRFSSELISKVGRNSLENYKTAASALFKLTQVIKEITKELYQDIDFKAWRQREEKEFLKQKRSEEKKKKIYPKPYIDYLDQQEHRLFQQFWDRYKWDFIVLFLTGIQSQPSGELVAVESLIPYMDYLSNWYREISQGAHQALDWHESYFVLQKALKSLSLQQAIDYLKTMRSYQELNRPLFGKYRGLRQSKNPLEKHLAAAFYPAYGFGCGRSYAYRQAAIQGSIFKLVAAYEALLQNFRKLNKKNITFNDLNPLVIVDQVYYEGNTAYVGYTADGKPIPQLYKGGRIPRSLAHKNNGEVDLIKALEVSSNPYFSLLVGECLENPEDLTRAASLFSYGTRTGINLPGEIAGQVPDDVDRNRTGLYALAIGQHSLVVTPMQTAVMLSTIANGGKVLKPKIVNLMAGRQPSRGEELITYIPSFTYQDSLARVGIDFPLFTAVSLNEEKNLVEYIPTEVHREIFMPTIIRQTLLKSLRAASQRTHQDSIISLTRLYRQHPEAIKDFTDLKNQIIGKTSTSESVEMIDLDLVEGTNIYTHVWFGGIVFPDKEENKKTFIFKDEFGQAELIVVVYLRYGGYGKEAAPLASQMVKKWKELKQKYAKKF